ncbi:MAG: hypothetical protein ACREDR_06670 [Blastocatellia bacterium]
MTENDEPDQTTRVVEFAMRNGSPKDTDSAAHGLKRSAWRLILIGAGSSVIAFGIAVGIYLAYRSGFVEFEAYWRPAPPWLQLPFGLIAGVFFLALWWVKRSKRESHHKNK